MAEQGVTVALVLGALRWEVDACMQAAKTTTAVLEEAAAVSGEAAWVLAGKRDLAVTTVEVSVPLPPTTSSQAPQVVLPPNAQAPHLYPDSLVVAASVRLHWISQRAAGKNSRSPSTLDTT